MDALHSTGEGQCIRFAPSARLHGSEQQGGSHAFATREKRVAHGFVDGRGPGFRLGQEMVQGGIHGFGAGLEPWGKRERGGAGS